MRENPAPLAVRGETGTVKAGSWRVKVRGRWKVRTEPTVDIKEVFTLLLFLSGQGHETLILHRVYRLFGTHQFCVFTHERKKQIKQQLRHFWKSAHCRDVQTSHIILTGRTTF